MALTVTLAGLRTLVRTRTDQVNSTQVTDAEINAWINVGMRHYVRQLVAANPDFYVLETSINTTSGTYEYALPAGFLQLRGVDKVEGDHRYTVHGFTWVDRNRWRTARPHVPRARVIRGGRDGSGARLQFASDPGTTTAGYLVHYTGVPDDLSADGDTLDDVIGLSDYVVIYAAACVREKLDELELAAGLRAELARAEASIQQMARMRTVDGTVVVGNARHDFYDDDGDRERPWRT
jgi:hypothetical protein